MVLKSLESKKYIKDTYAWRHHYFMLTEEGEKFIRNELDIGEFTRPDPCSKSLAANFEPAERPRVGVEAKAEWICCIDLILTIYIAHYYISGVISE